MEIERFIQEMVYTKAHLAVVFRITVMSRFDGRVKMCDAPFSAHTENSVIQIGLQ